MKISVNLWLNPFARLSDVFEVARTDAAQIVFTPPWFLITFHSDGEVQSTNQQRHPPVKAHRTDVEIWMRLL